MADFFREVDEEVRRDRAMDFWKKYQTPIVVLAVLIVVAAGSWRGWQAWSLRKAHEASAAFEAAAQLAREDGKTEEARAAFEKIVQSGPAGYALMARFRAADELAEKDKAGAVKAFDALALDASVDPLLQDVARLRAALLRIDDADEAEMGRRLQNLAAAGGPFRHSARELIALSALKANNFEAAAKWLDMLVVDQQTPAGLRQRAEAWLGLVASGKPPIEPPAAPQSTAPAPATPETPEPETPAPEAPKP